MRKVLYAVLALIVLSSCGDDIIRTGTKDFRCSVSLNKDVLVSGVGGSIALRIESNKQRLLVDDYTVTYLDKNVNADVDGWIRFPIPHGEGGNEIQINEDGYVEFWCADVDLKDRGGRYLIKLRLYDPSSNTYSENFSLEFYGQEENKVLGKSFYFSSGWASKTKDFYLSFDEDSGENTLFISSIKDDGSKSGEVGIIVDDANGVCCNVMVLDENASQEDIDTNKSKYSMFIQKDGSSGESTAKYKITAGGLYNPGAFIIYDKQDPSNRQLVRTQLRHPVCICLSASVGDASVKRGTTQPLKLKSYGWYGVFSSNLAAHLMVFRNRDEKNTLAKNISTGVPSWRRSNAEVSDADKSYHMGVEKTNSYDNGFHLYDYLVSEFNGDYSRTEDCKEDVFKVTFHIVTNWTGQIQNRLYKGNRNGSICQHYNDLSTVSIPKDNKREFQLTFKADDTMSFPELTEAMNFCCCLCVVANNFNSGTFSSTACTDKDGATPEYFGNFGTFGLEITDVEFDKDKYRLMYFIEHYRGINSPDFIRNYNREKGTGMFGYDYAGGRTVWYEGLNVPPVQNLSRFN